MKCEQFREIHFIYVNSSSLLEATMIQDVRYNITVYCCAVLHTEVGGMMYTRVDNSHN